MSRVTTNQAEQSVTARPRRRFAFSLRTLFVAVTLAGVGTALGSQLNWLRQRRALLSSWSASAPATLGQTPRAPGMLWLFGEQGRSRVIVLNAGDEQLADVQRLFPEAKVEAEWLCGGVQ